MFIFYLKPLQFIISWRHMIVFSEPANSDTSEESFWTLAFCDFVVVPQIRQTDRQWNYWRNSTHTFKTGTQLHFLSFSFFFFFNFLIYSVPFSFYLFSFFCHFPFNFLFIYLFFPFSFFLLPFAFCLLYFSYDFFPFSFLHFRFPFSPFTFYKFPFSFLLSPFSFYLTLIRNLYFRSRILELEGKCVSLKNVICANCVEKRRRYIYIYHGNFSTVFVW